MKKIRLFFLSLLSMIAWTGVLAQTAEEYQAALDAIEDGAAYSIKTTVSGTAYYLTTEGYLTDEESEAGVFLFSKVEGDEWEFGFNLLDSYFTNPPSGGNPTLNNGHIAVDPSSKRKTWEAQVFFLKGDKYAIRATNAGGGDSGWPLNAKTFWTVNDGPVAEYSFDVNYVWELEEVYTPDRVVELQEAAKVVQSWITAIQGAKGLVQDPDQYYTNAWIGESIGIPGLLDNEYTTYLHTTWQGGVEEPHYLQAQLPDATQKFQFYFKKRHNNNNNRPIKIAISACNDGENFEEIVVLDHGFPTDASVIDYLSDIIDLGAAYQYVRFTILDTNNHATDVNGNYFFTFSEFYILPTIPEAVAALSIVKARTPWYQLDPEEVAAIDEALTAALNTVTVTYELYEADGTTLVSKKKVIQEGGSEVKVPADFTNSPFYDYSVTGTIGDTDCTITIIRSFKEGLVMDLADLSNTKAYTIACNRGAFLTKDGFLASTKHSSLTNATPGAFAIINYDDNYYLYSVADKQFVQNNGALSDMPTNEEEDAIQMKNVDGWASHYFLYSFTKNGADNGLNTNGNDPYGYVINSWMNADDGNMYYMIEAADFDPTEALAALEAQYDPSQFVVYVVEDEKGNEIFESDPEPAWKGRIIKTLPDQYKLDFMTYEEVHETIGTDEYTEVVITGIWDGPFEIAEDFESANWQNISVRGSWYYTSDEYAEDGALLTVNANALGLVEDAYQWAFIGDPYHLMLVNKEQGEGVAFVHHDFASGSIPVFEDIEDVENEEDLYWNIMKSTSNIENSFLLNIYGTNSCVNQYGGAGGSLKLWNSTGNLGDVGSAFVIFDIPTNFAEFTGEIEKVMTDPTEGYFTLNSNAKKLWKDSYKEECSYAIYSRLQNAIDDEDNWIWPETGYYRIQSKEYPGRYLSYVDFEGKPCVGAVEYDEEPTTVSTVVKLEEVGDHEYFISLAGGYVPDPQTSVKIELDEEATVFEAVIVAPGVGAFTTENNSIHCADTQDYYCVGWTYNAGASQWTLTDAEGVIIDLYQADDDAEKSYATTYLPFSIQIADDAAAYTVTTKGDWAIPAIIGEGDEVPAFTPVLLISDSGEPSIWADIVDDMDLYVEDNVLWGTMVDAELSDVFVLNAVDGEVGFYALNGILSANKAFIPNAVGVKGFKLGDTTTAIKSLNAAENNTAIFNLAGQRVSKARKGVFIKEGKKVVK